ncbi:acyl-coenzyme A synthetase ACSM1, mitochondrial-like [Halichoerus grypus]
MDRSSALRGLRTVRNRSKLWHSPWNEDQAGFHRGRHPPPSTSRSGPKGICWVQLGLSWDWTIVGHQIIDDKGNSLPFNTEGNTGIRMKPTKPIGLFMGYEDNPVKTAEVECGDFYNSGDRAPMDEEGYIWFLGRNDDIINASGYRIGPAEVENALAEHPAVAESAVVSSLDPIRREVGKAFIVLTPEFLSHGRDQLTKELQQHVKSVTAP